MHLLIVHLWHLTPPATLAPQHLRYRDGIRFDTHTTQVGALVFFSGRGGSFVSNRPFWEWVWAAARPNCVAHRSVSSYPPRTLVKCLRGNTTQQAHDRGVAKSAAQVVVSGGGCEENQVCHRIQPPRVRYIARSSLKSSYESASPGGSKATIAFNRTQLRIANFGATTKPSSHLIASSLSRRGAPGAAQLSHTKRTPHDRGQQV